MAGLPDFAELHSRSCFSFLTGASQPAELVKRAHELGYRALALTDECSLAGVVRAYEAAKEVKDLHLVIGAEMRLAAAPPPVLLRPRSFSPAVASAPREESHEHLAAALPHPHRPTGDGARLLLLAQSRRGYSHLSKWISLARRRADKGSYIAY